MLYPKCTSKELEKELFENPTCEYRGTPFWAWNCRLTPELLTRQIEYLKEMGFGGFHMHSRTGMATPYLGNEFMDLIKICVEKARSEKMLAWLYDEDRWPSGSAGGLVTKNREYRSRFLLFTPNPYQNESLIKGNDISASVGQRMENGVLLARYDIRLEKNGCLTDYHMLAEDETGKNVWYAYLEVTGISPWFNNQAYVNTLDKKAIDEFIRITYESYKNAVGDDFGGIIPSIFTDEPQFSRKTTLGFASEKKDVFIPWTDDLSETFKAAYGTELLHNLPELFWELPNGQISETRYHYHDHIAQRFADAFAINCGDWCRKNNLMLTGHMMDEPTLHSQTAALGEAMRSYQGFDLPGIDMLCDAHEYTTAKQAQSAKNQFGRKGMISELYGVTNWDYDFRGHKMQGDWQAALGVTVRVPHLSWVSMKGEAKRDYPASINYQSPWFKEYPLIENHFARLSTALTRGKPIVHVGIIHPIESYWLYFGPAEQTAGIRDQLDYNFKNVTEWMIFGQIDFDFIAESLLPIQCEKGDAPLEVGEMQYDTIIIPGCITLRSSTVERLELFQKCGGKLIVMGELPKYVDAKSQNNRLDFLKEAQHIPFENNALLTQLEPVREIDIRNESGIRTDYLITQFRQDGDKRWLFIANGKSIAKPDVVTERHLTISIAGRWKPEIYETMTGEVKPINASFSDSNTIIEQTTYSHDSILLCLSPEEPSTEKLMPSSNKIQLGEGFVSAVPVTLSEPNVLLLDIAEYAFDDGEFEQQEEILRIDNLFRKKLGIPSRNAGVAQPWVIKAEKPEHLIHLRFTIKSELDLENVFLALEDAEDTDIILNGEKIDNLPCGYYVDESIKTVELKKIMAGTNTLELTTPFGKNTNLEWCYLLGDFGVKVSGFCAILTAPVRELAFGDIVPQGLPFYGGNILYKLSVDGNEKNITVHIPSYRGALIGVTLDGDRVGTIAFEPYNFTIPNLSKGKHEIGLTLFGNRVNSFGAVHNNDNTLSWFGPDSWRTINDSWSYEYVLNKTGILKSPAIIED